MRFNMPAICRAAALAGGTALVAMAAPASAAVQSGVLTCNIAGGLGAVVASQRAVSCTFKPAGRRAPVEYYTGSFTRLGLDLSLVNNGVLTYNVVSASNGYVPFSLAGSYTGPGLGLTLGNGLGVDALVGGNGNQVTLQPLAVSTSTGVGINAGIGSLTLTPAGEVPRHHRHHRRPHHHHG